MNWVFLFFFFFISVFFKIFDLVFCIEFDRGPTFCVHRKRNKKPFNHLFYRISCGLLLFFLYERACVSSRTFWNFNFVNNNVYICCAVVVDFLLLFFKKKIFFSKIFLRFSLHYSAAFCSFIFLCFSHFIRNRLVVSAIK